MRKRQNKSLKQKRSLFLFLQQFIVFVGYQLQHQENLMSVQYIDLSVLAIWLTVFYLKMHL